MYDEIAIEKQIEAQFGLRLEVNQMIAGDIPVSPTSRATVFMTPKKQLYVYVSGQSRLLFGDIKKIITRMKLVSERYLEPKGQSGYFDTVARDKFLEVFPGRQNITEDDLRFYKTLVPYSPALILIRETVGEHIYQYDSDASGNWRPSAKFKYRRISTS